MFMQILGKLPHDFWSRTPAALLDQELVQEKASALGRFGRQLEASLKRLATFDSTHPRYPLHPEDVQARGALVSEAARVLWHFIVQREACGLFDSRAVMQDYKVPGEIQREMGAMSNARQSCRI
jgi:hypothetical protein